MGALGGQMQPYEMQNFMQQGSQSANPFQLKGAGTYTGGQPSNAFDRENVQASQGAGAAPGADWTSRLGQQAGQDMGQMQRQQQLQQAAMMRATPTPGGMQAWGQQQQGGGDAQRWGQMMQGLQGMRPGGQGQGGMMGGMRPGNRF